MTDGTDGTSADFARRSWRLDLEAFENISEVILHLALLPLYAWPERLEPSETAGSLLLPALEIQLNVSHWGGGKRMVDPKLFQRGCGVIHRYRWRPACS